ncbi:flagellar basal body P-ring formation chaperone FlgA [Massilia psychrophila]|uniref:Flagella basal body P-ring formation protein FlgA n=1 Tax=Massilia psychrophila TaxID=1603353 RepID=A0A2G8SY01_9BURK|nr:flagellar basal body P-ring formation chaperone FlgA [Massilia psychrophila]PIL38358.1 flagellar biosynthesis protein FlgA [Massilia psychrophila]GGE84631.1 flagellar basal body P-ring biosynthesis protein FlgA [Massilia psychrophila]
MNAIFLTALLLTTPLALAQQSAAARAGTQDLTALRTVVQQYLQAQSAGMAGKASVEVRAIDPRTSLPACPDPQAFQQPGARTMGNTTVGVRCTAPAAWTVYIQAKVSVQGDYVAAAVPLAQGQPIEQSQLVLMKGDLAAMPNGVVTDMAQAIGRSSTVSLPSGAPLRLDALRSKPVVQQGQLVRVVSSGEGFRVSAEARAIGNASEGQVVQVRTPAGAIISGVAKAGGLVEVVF